MALKLKLETLDGLDEAHTTLYVKQGNAYVLDVEGGFKTQADVDKVQQALVAERAVSKGLKEALGAWGDRKPEDVLPILDKLPELEAAATAGKGKIDQAQLDNIVKGRLAPYERDLAKAQAELQQAQAAIVQHQTADRNRTIQDAVRTAAAEAGVNPLAYNSPVGGLSLLSQQLYTVDDNGDVVVKEDAHKLVPSLIPGTAVKESLNVLQQTHAYFWPASNGGGAGGTKDGGGPIGNPFKTNNMSARGEFALANKDKPQVIERALREAGLDNMGQKYLGK